MKYLVPNMGRCFQSFSCYMMNDPLFTCDVTSRQNVPVDRVHFTALPLADPFST